LGNIYVVLGADVQGCLWDWEKRPAYPGVEGHPQNAAHNQRPAELPGKDVSPKATLDIPSAAEHSKAF
jgi:hypothetical protein